MGLLLPCNVVVRQAEQGAVQVELMDTGAVLKLVDKPAITALAAELRQRLGRVVRALRGVARPQARQRSVRRGCRRSPRPGA
ncbi:MAG TPA: DUF302 domain-containing protein [Telluria sp.]|nr:DUF302 domain-containing protein [Telluria sp.]